MSERVQYVHIQFHEGVTSPANANMHGAARSVLLDAFCFDDRKVTRKLRLERVGDAVIATDIRTGFIREYPWGTVRQALRVDEGCINGDPRQGPKEKGK